MANYKTFTRLTDYGPFIVKFILELPNEVCTTNINKDMFNVYVQREEENGEILMRKERGADKAYPSVGYRNILKAYVSDEFGKPSYKNKYVTLDMDEDRVGKKIEGNVLASRYVNIKNRITQLAPIEGDECDITGLVFDTCTGDICPQLKNWENSVSTHASTPLKYGFYKPTNEKQNKLPLVIWLHGAGEGGNNPLVAYTGNRVTSFSDAINQKKFGGEAYVLVPQCPTVWMDDGVEKLGFSNQSIYVEPLKYLIDEFIRNHDDIDTNRIYVTGCSNGGFMSMRMVFDYPGFFAAAAPVCQAFFNKNATDEMIDTIKDTPIWFVHAKNDELVDPTISTIPLYERLIKAGAKDVHFSYFDYVEDPTGQYKDELGRPKRIFNHGVWVIALDDEVTIDYDGSRVLSNNIPRTLMEWMGDKHK